MNFKRKLALMFAAAGCFFLMADPATDIRLHSDLHVPEQDELSGEMVKQRKAYVRKGGTLILTGSCLFDRFGAEFLGAESVRDEAKARYFLPDGSDGTVPLYSSAWRLLRPATGPLTFHLKIARQVRSVRGAWEHPEELKWSWKEGVLTCLLPQLRLYEAILID